MAEPIYLGKKPSIRLGETTYVHEESRATTPQTTSTAITLRSRDRRKEQRREKAKITLVPPVSAPPSEEITPLPEPITIKPKPTLRQKVVSKYRQIVEKPKVLLEKVETKIAEKLAYTPPPKKEKPGVIDLTKTKYKELPRIEQQKMKALAVARGLVIAPVSAVKIGYGLVTQPVVTTKEVVKGFAGLPQAFRERPVETAGELLGQALFFEATGGALRTASTKVQAIKATTKITPKVAIEITKTEALKIGETPEGLGRYAVSVESKIRTYNPKTGAEIGKPKIVGTEVVEVSARTESGAVKSAFEGYSTSLRQGLRTYTKEGKVTAKFDVAKGKGTATLSPTQVEGLYRGTAKAKLEQYGEIGVAIRPLSREIALTTREYIVKPKAEALSNILVKEAGMKPSVIKLGGAYVSVEEYSAGMKTLTDIFQTKYKVKGYLKAKEPVIETIKRVKPYLRGFAKEQKGFKIGGIGMGKAYIPKEVFLELEELQSPLLGAKLSKATKYKINKEVAKLAEPSKEMLPPREIKAGQIAKEIAKPAVREEATAIAVGRAFAEQATGLRAREIARTPIVRKKSLVSQSAIRKFQKISGTTTGLNQLGAMGVSGRQEIKDYQKFFGAEESGLRSLGKESESARIKERITTKRISQTFTGTKTGLSTSTITGIRTVTVPITAPITPTMPFPKIPRPIIPSIKAPKPIYYFEPPKKKKKVPKKYYPFGKPKKRKPAYQPSAGAVALRITARKIPKKFFTGLELRPVITKKGQRLPFL